MKLYEVVLLVLVFNISIMLLSTANIFGSVSPQCMADATWVTGFNQTAASSIGVLPNVPNSQTSDWFSGIIEGMKMFSKALWAATFNLGNTMTDCLYIDSTLANIITYGMWFIYVIGIIQFISGRAINQNE